MLKNNKNSGSCKCPASLWSGAEQHSCLPFPRGRQAKEVARCFFLQREDLTGTSVWCGAAPTLSVTADLAEENSSHCARRPALCFFCSRSERQPPCWDPRPSWHRYSLFHLSSALPNYSVSSSGQSQLPCAQCSGALMWVRALGHWMQ